VTMVSVIVIKSKVFRHNRGIKGVRSYNNRHQEENNRSRTMGMHCEVKEGKNNDRSDLHVTT
jgi:hypothetical protein